MRTARYRFRDASGSESSTSVRLSGTATDSAVLSLASALSDASDATLIGVEVLQRIVYRDNPGALMPDRVRVAIRNTEAIPMDGWHSILPVGSTERAQPILEYLTLAYDWCTRSGAPIEGATQVYAVPAYPNWRNYDPPYPTDAPKWIVVLDDRLWRDLLATSMVLNSETLRDALLATSPARNLARYQLVELLRGVPLDEVINRLDLILNMLEQIRDREEDARQYVDELEPLLSTILAAL